MKNINSVPFAKSNFEIKRIMEVQEETRGGGRKNSIFEPG